MTAETYNESMEKWKADGYVVADYSEQRKLKHK